MSESGGGGNYDWLEAAEGKSMENGGEGGAEGELTLTSCLCFPLHLQAAIVKRRKEGVKGEEEGEGAGWPFLCDGVALRWAYFLFGWQVREGGRKGGVEKSGTSLSI